MKKPQSMIVGVLGLAVDNKGRYLLTQRNQPKDPEVHARWQIPGGKHEFGETTEQTLAREMQEELLVSVRILFPHPIAKISVWDYADREDHVTLLTYLVSVGDQRPAIGEPESLDFGWFTVQEIHVLDTLKITTDIVDEAEKIRKAGGLSLP